MRGSLLSLPASRSRCCSSCEPPHGQRTEILSTLLSSGGAGSSFRVAPTSSPTGDRRVVGRCCGLRPSSSRLSQPSRCWGRYGTTPMKAHLYGSSGKPSSSSSAASPLPLRRLVRRDGSDDLPADVADPGLGRVALAARPAGRAVPTRRRGVLDARPDRQRELRCGRVSLAARARTSSRCGSAAS